MLKLLDLFSGIGGFSLGLERTGGFKTVAFCEIDPFCQKVLKKHWPDVPIYDDVRTIDYEGAIDVITGGYPCQPFSCAGRRKGERDNRNLWPFMFSLIQKHRPTWVIGENVTGHISMGLDQVIIDLESAAYTCRPFVIPACGVDAKQRRDRIWIVANATAAISERTGRARPRGKGLTNNRRWAAEPDVGRMVDGVPGRVDRIRALGNAVVPQIPETIGYAILAAHSNVNHHKPPTP